MEIAVAVLYVYRSTQRKDGSVASEGSKPAICFRGKKHALCVILDYPIRVIRRAAADYDKCRPVPVPMSQPDAKVYPLALAVAHLEERVSRYGITEGAQKLLALAKRVSTGATITEDDLQENVFTDEETLPSKYPPGVPPSGWVASPEAAQAPQDVGTGNTPKEQRRRNKRAGPVVTTVADGKPVEGGASTAGEGKRTRTRGADSPMKKAVEYMRAEVEKIGGLQEVTKDWRNQLFKRAAEQFGISPNTCGVQWGRTLLPSMGMQKGTRTSKPAAAQDSEEKSTAAATRTDPAAARTAVKPKAEAPQPSPGGASAGAKRRAPVRGEASPMNQAVAYMQEEVAKLGGLDKVTKDWRKQLFERAAQRFGISPNTCNVQWGKKIAKK